MKAPQQARTRMARAWKMSEMSALAALAVAAALLVAGCGEAAKLSPRSRPVRARNWSSRTRP
jgi:hypothetical protein